MPRGPEERGLGRRAAAWIVYDVGSSAYLLLIPAVGYAVFYRQLVCGGGPGADVRWGTAVAVGLGIAGVLAPWIGALADRGGLRHPLLVATTVACCAFAASLATVGPGDVLLGAALFIGAQIAFTLAISLYDSYVRDLAPPGAAARLSGIGWGVGYAGGIACFGLVYPSLEGGATLENLDGYRRSFLITAAFYLVLAIPAFLLLPRRPAAPDLPGGRGSLLVSSYREIFATLRDVRRHREAFKFLGAYYCVNDAVVTVLYFMAIYLQTTWGYGITDTLFVTIAIQVIGIPATILFGVLGDRWSARGAILLSIAIGAGAILVMVLGTHPSTPWIMAVALGISGGSVQSLCRAAYGRMVPLEKLNEFFGFNAFASRVSAVLAPFVFGAVSSATGDPRHGVATALLFLGAGAAIIATVRFPPGPGDRP